MQSILTNHFLIAMPSLQDVNFHRSVTYIAEHSENGAVGIIINQPTDLNLAEVFAQMEISSELEQMNQTQVLHGGPVEQERGFIIHRPFGVWRSSIETADNICITTSKDILEAMAAGNGPEEVIIALGYAGWSAGQLEAELAENAWLSCEANSDVLFKVPYADRWEEAAKLIGVDINSISGGAGHA